jgi:DNA polymerase-4
LNSHTDAPDLVQAPILHVDIDAFFASVEILDDPSLRGLPVAVGGAGERGVIASASYVARTFGIHSAMSSIQARRRCPSLIILPGRFDRYESYSKSFHDLVRDVTPNYEPLGLDEVFCDLSSLGLLGSAPLALAHDLQARLKAELGLQSGIGVARNKLFAKLGSKAAKPKFSTGGVTEGAGVFWVSPDVEAQWLDSLPVESLWGVGPKTASKLHGLGLRLVRDLLSVDEKLLASHVGASVALTLCGFARGDDDRSVESARASKSIGHEETFARSVTDAEELAQHIRRHASVVGRAVRESHQLCRTITVVVRFDNLSAVTRQQTVPFSLNDEEAIATIALALIDSIGISQPVRLAGVSASSFVAEGQGAVQLSFGVANDTIASQSAEVQAKRESLRDAIDDIRQRFGVASLGHGVEFADGNLRVDRQRGSHAFGPETLGTSSESQ